jgi:ATP-dependent protease ClpP protease subunit
MAFRTAIVATTGVTKETVAELEDGNTWLTGEQMVGLGIATGLYDPEAHAAAIEEERQL